MKIMETPPDRKGLYFVTVFKRGPSAASSVDDSSASLKFKDGSANRPVDRDGSCRLP